MRIWLYAAAGACIALGALGAPAVQAAPMSVDRLDVVQDFNLTQDVQYFYAGRRYCFYPDGWRGPGFYWCGYNYRSGLGWGGPSGWRGWGGRGPRRMVVRPHVERRMEMRREMRRDMHGGGRRDMRSRGNARHMRGGDR